ncbi:IS110 family transposase, partial [Quadrisphaera setariae]
EGRRHNAALICLSRRRIDVMFAMLRDRQPYRPRPFSTSGEATLAA